MGKITVYLLYFCVYSFVILVIGKSSLHGSRSVRDYFVCGRSVSLPMCICTFTGTWVSAIMILSMTGSLYEDGISALMYSAVPWFIGAGLLAAMAYRLYENDIVTVPEYFKVRYGSTGLQAIYGLILVGVYIFYLVTQYKGFGLVAATIFDIPYPLAVGMIYLFILYTTMGGYRSVVRTDVFNLILLVCGLGVISFTIISQIGSVEELISQAKQVEGFAYSGMEYPTERGGLFRLFTSRYAPWMSVSMVASWGLGVAANPQYIVRILGAKDKKTARSTVTVSLVLLTVIIVMLVIIGIGMRVLVPVLTTQETTDSIFIRIINNELYSKWSGFFLFSVFGACLSTANSQLLIISSSISYDFIYARWPDRITGKKVVNISRLSVLLGGTLAMFMALTPPDFTLSYGSDVWGVISILLFPPLFGGLLSQKCNAAGVKTSLVVGGLSIVFLYPLYHMGLFRIHPAAIGVAISTIGLVVGSAYGRKEAGQA